MATEATYRGDAGVHRENSAAAALTSGQVVLLDTGKVGIVQGAASTAAGDAAAFATAGKFKFAKAATVIMFAGQPVWWDDTNSQACISTSSTKTHYLGIVAHEVAVADTTVEVYINEEASPYIKQGDGDWEILETLGLGVRDIAGTNILAFDTTSEAATAALISKKSVTVEGDWIMQAEVAVYDIGNNAALDINVGMANATHATDFDSVTEQVTIHLDGNALSILAESDDGTTEVAATDTTVDAVDDTYFLLQIDARDTEDIQVYINGVNVLPSSVFKLDEATGPMKAVAYMEKSSDDTSADLRVRDMMVWKGVSY